MNKKLFKVVLVIGIAAIVAAGLIRFIPYFNPGKASIVTSSTLTKAIDIAELSTAEFKYRGIAEVYSDENQTNIRCRICYDAVVKAGINMKDVHFDIDNENKVVTATLPEIGIKVNIIEEQSMAVLPSNADIGIADMLRYSKEDVEKEATQSEELKTAARDNLEAMIRGLLMPILGSQGYTLNYN